MLNIEFLFVLRKGHVVRIQRMPVNLEQCVGEKSRQADNY